MVYTEEATGAYRPEFHHKRTGRSFKHPQPKEVMEMLQLELDEGVRQILKEAAVKTLSALKVKNKALKEVSKSKAPAPKSKVPVSSKSKKPVSKAPPVASSSSSSSTGAPLSEIVDMASESKEKEEKLNTLGPEPAKGANGSQERFFWNQWTRKKKVIEEEFKEKEKEKQKQAKALTAKAKPKAATKKSAAEAPAKAKIKAKTTKSKRPPSPRASPQLRKRRTMKRTAKTKRMKQRKQRKKTSSATSEWLRERRRRTPGVTRADWERVSAAVTTAPAKSRREGRARARSAARGVPVLLMARKR
jgi:hypothetical protein